MNAHVSGTALTLVTCMTFSAGCAVELTAGSAPNTDDGVSSIAQAETQGDLISRCGAESGSCIFLTPQLTYRAIFEVPFATPPGLFHSWLYPRVATVVAGCGSDDSFCELDLQDTCALALDLGAGYRIIAVLDEIYKTQPYALSSSWSGHISIPLNGCVLQACTAPPASAPVFTIQTDYCRGRHTRNWTEVSGATYYQVQAKPWWDTFLGIGPTTPWESIPRTFTYPGIIVDLPGTTCRGNSTSSYYARARACNDCGCSDWSAPDYFEYWTGSCA